MVSLGWALVTRVNFPRPYRGPENHGISSWDLDRRQPRGRLLFELDGDIVSCAALIGIDQIQ